MRQYIISLDIDPINQNAVYATLPLHCTLMPRFETPMSAAEIGTLVEDVFKRCGFIPIVSDALERFGMHKDVWAHRIQPEDRVRDLHKEILKVLQDAGAEFTESSQWLGDTFTPHVSHAMGKAFSRGQTHVFRTATIIERCIVSGTRILRPRVRMHL